MERWSDEEDRPEQVQSLAPQKEPKNMAWREYLLYLTLLFGTKALGFCDYFGGKFACFFGITSAKYQGVVSILGKSLLVYFWIMSAKYQYVIDEAEWRRSEAREETAREERETPAKAKRNRVVSMPPSSGVATSMAFQAEALAEAQGNPAGNKHLNSDAGVLNSERKILILNCIQ